MTSQRTIIEALERLTTERGFIYSLALMLRRDLFFSPEEAASINWAERLSYQEFSLLAGLMVKHEIGLGLPSQEVVESQIHRTYELFRGLHQSQNEGFLRVLVAGFQQKEAKGSDTNGNDLSSWEGCMAEPILYGGSGAYDFQYLELAPKRYIADNAWMLSRKGISIETMAQIATKLKQLCERKLRNLPEPKDFEEFCNGTLAVFCFSPQELRDFGIETVRDFLSSFSMSPGAANKNLVSPGDYNVLDSHPLIQLKQDLYFLPVSFNLARSVYESPFYWMLDDLEYRDMSSKHRGTAVEDMAHEMLATVFGKENVYKDVRIFKGKKTISDIDVLAVAGNKAVILQAKSKKLTELARKGDTGQLKADFEEAIQKSYEQGLKCRAALMDEENTLRWDRGDKFDLRESIDDAYIICLTSDHFPAVTHQTDVYLKKRPQGPYPVAASIFDLDILTSYLRDPFDFLYYLRQRVSLSDYFKATSEIALLGWHLKKKLFRMPEYTDVLVDEGFAQLIDANFPAVRGHFPRTKAMELLHHRWRNDRFERLVSRVKETGEPGFTDALFLLYDLAGSSADDLIDVMEMTKEKTSKDGQPHDFTMIFEKPHSGITFLCELGSLRTLERDLLSLSTARKYKTKAETWLAMGSLVGSPNVIDFVAFNKEPWVEDKQLEEFTKVALKPGVPYVKPSLNEKGDQSLGNTL